MHIHIYVKLGFWHRLGIALVLLSAVCLVFIVIRYAPTQNDVLPCLEQVVAGQGAIKKSGEILENCRAEIIKAAVEVHQLSFTVKSVLIWLGIVISAYAFFLFFYWVRTGKLK